ncbi:MAG: hypothetical protein IJV88_07100 [Ruminococcus sp.]|nr:hypothetical protein [Ruminococcus sp.]
MKKIYSEPTINVFMFAAPDCIRASTEYIPTTTTVAPPITLAEDVVGDAKGSASDFVW